MFLKLFRSTEKVRQYILQHQLQKERKEGLEDYRWLSIIHILVIKIRIIKRK